MHIFFLIYRLGSIVVLTALFLILGACDNPSGQVSSSSQVDSDTAAKANSRSEPSPVLPIEPPFEVTTNCRGAQELPSVSAPDIHCSAPPNTFDVSSFFAADVGAEKAAQAGPTWDSWAWASFAAMNWPAKEDASQASGYVRGVPDSSRSFANAKNDDVLVWETFKEKRELFNKGDGEAKVVNGVIEYPSSVNQNSKWQDITYAKPQTVNGSGGIPLCAGASEDIEAPTHRIFAQRAKAANYTDFTETDETVEVASQPCEAATKLCEGLPSVAAAEVPSMQDCIDNIFPGTVTGVCGGDKVDQRTPVGPRVWKGDPGAENSNARPVYFEVKVNYDFWQYILDKEYYLDKNAVPAAASPDRKDHPKLPFRTSSDQGPGRSPNATFGYDANKTAANYQALQDPNTLPGAGSVQLKAGWLVLNENEIASKSYHTTSGYYFKSEPLLGSKDTQTCAQPATFGLLGLHIIQRVHALEPDNRESDFAYGGTFVFATWEHVGLGEYQQPSDFYYANYLAFSENFYLQGGPLSPINPNNPAPFNFDTNLVPFPYWKTPGVGALPVVREQPYPLATTTSVNNSVHSEIKKTNPNSVWLNYRLIGTQFFAADFETVAENARQPSETRFNQPYYLANLVVETNTDLQNFQGLPPGVDATSYYTAKVGGLPAVKTQTQTFHREDSNLVFNRQNIGTRNMGGCMGCHGVAQLGGFNFSFVFKGGQEGSGLDTLSEFAVAGGGPEPKK